MNSSDNQATPYRLRAVHLWTLSSFAITQPLLAALARQTVYLHDQRIGWIEVGILLLLLMFIIPAGVLFADWSFQRLSQHWGGRGCNTVLILLLVVLLLSLLRPYSSNMWLIAQGSSGLLLLGVVTPCSWFLASTYEKSPSLKSWLTLSSLGLLLFPVMFLWQFQRIQAREHSVEGRVSVNSPVPVVLIVFDEFSGTTLMNEQMEINERHFPQFARLAGISTWYRNASTVSPRTDVAVPAILSGQFPVATRSPLANEYPGNLLQLIEASKAYEMSVFEPVTRLCPNLINDEPLPDRSHYDKSMDLISTLAAVYPRLIFTTDTPIWFPTIPKPWFGLRVMANLTPDRDKIATEGAFNYPGTERRRHQLQHVLKCLKPSEHPRFCFLHTVLPHYPWTFLPSGDQYQSEFAAPGIPSSARGELGEDWDDDPAAILRNEFRYRLQVGYVDRFIGELLDQLETTGLLEKCLLIVTADHGVAFRPGYSRRIPNLENLADIFSVPLFIRYPGQSAPMVDDRNVQSIDILPTIAEILGMELPEPIDGIPISSQVRHGRKTLYFENAMTVVEPELPQRAAAVERQHQLFGKGELDQLPVAAVKHPDWVGRPISDFRIVEHFVPAELYDLHSRRHETGRPFAPIIDPRLITGAIAARDLSAVPAEIVLAVDGTVLDSCNTYSIAGTDHGFQFLIPKSMKEITPSSVELFVADSTKSDPVLRRLKITSDTKIHQ